MQALILAAGMATRLRPLTADRPKCLLEVGGRPLLGRALDALRACGIADLTVVTGYLHEQIDDYLAREAGGIRCRTIYNKEYATTNNIHSLWLAREAVAGSDFVLLDSDIVFDAEILRRLLAAPQDNILAVSRHELGEEEIKVVPDAEGLVAEISKTCDIAAAVGESIGIERMGTAYSRALYAELKRMIVGEGLSGVFYERAFERLIAQGHRFAMLDTAGLFAAELDTADDFRAAKEDIAALAKQSRQ